MVETKVLGPRDLDQLIELIRVYEDVFEMEDFTLPSPSYLQSLLERPGLTFLVAIVEGKVVGGLTAHDLPSTYSEAYEVYVYDLGVARSHQRQGIGRALLQDLKKRCGALGTLEFFLQAELPDTHAIDFYRAVGGTEEHVVHFSFTSPPTSTH